MSAKVTYKGPGDSVTVDGIRIDKGETVELDGTQLARLQADPDAQLEIEHVADTAEGRTTVREAQDKLRDKQATDATSASPKTSRRAAPKES